MEEIRKEPWFTETANKHLAELLETRKKWDIFEFGSGASTLWFAKHKNVSKLVSVEHDHNWHLTIFNKLKSEKQHCQFIDCILADQPYNEVINSNGKFDLIIVDGRNRVKCIKSAISHLSEGGVLVLDNSEREYYSEGIELLKEFDRIDFLQPNPDKYGFTYPDWKTTFFTKK